jgi:hypothetical protein
MSPKKIPSRAIDRSKYIIYLNKAQDFYQAMRRSMDEGNWNSAGLEAVHCAISATDALLAYAGGIRCTSRAHSDAAELVKQTIRSSEAAKNCRHFLRIVNVNHPPTESRGLVGEPLQALWNSEAIFHRASPVE